MRFTFLGTGTSAGIPAIACDCAVCTSTDPHDRRLRTAAALEWTDADGRPRTVLIDAGPDLRTQALRAGLKRCDAILFTHNHVDHTFGLDEVRRFNAVQKTPIDIFAEPHTMEHLQRIYKHIFDKTANVNDSFVATLLPRLVKPGEPIDLWGVRFTPIRLLHGKLPIVGYRIEEGPKAIRRTGDPSGAAPTSPFPLAYCTDVSAIPPESYPLLRGLNTLVLDALRHRRHPTHLTVEQAVDIAHQVGAPRTYFIHIAHDLPHTETNAALPEGMQLAHDGLVLAAPLAEPPNIT
ncbi:MAG: MBL fold metallo-hydrolase [Phycisphaerales bacterium]